MSEKQVLKQSDNEETDDEWKNIKALPIIDLSKNNALNYDGNYDRQTSVTLDQVIEYFETLDVTEQSTRIQPTLVKKGFYGLFSHLFRLSPQSINQNLIDERNRIFSIALHTFDNHNSNQTRFLITIYHKLTGSELLDCTRIGNHWENIGFQGTDPTTDLRGVGLLGLLQLLYLILSPETSKLSKEIYRLSMDSRQHFPFAIMSTNITQISLQVLREGLLNKECNRNKCVLKVFNWYYSGIFLKLFKVWKENNKTIVDSGYVLRDIKKVVRHDVRQVIADVFNYKNETQNKQIENNNENINFTNLGDMFSDDDD